MKSTLCAQAALDQSRVLFTAGEVTHAYDALAEQISAKLSTANPVVVAVLTGGMVTVVELLKRFAFPCQLDYVHVARYGDALKGGTLRWIRAPSVTLANRHVLLVDDILDEGVTLNALKVNLETLPAASIHTAVLLAKASTDQQCNVDFVGLQMQQGYVFGCGMDYRGYWRGLTDIRVLEE